MNREGEAPVFANFGGAQSPEVNLKKEKLYFY